MPSFSDRGSQLLHSLSITQGSEKHQKSPELEFAAFEVWVQNLALSLTH